MRTHEEIKLMSVWTMIRHRCLNPKTKSYKDYGGRGIQVCERWTGVGGFKNFIADMGPRPDGFMVERKNNDGPYSPENCVWASRGAQSRNKRNNRKITFGGKTQVLGDWARDMGITHSGLIIRIRRWGIEKALTEPIPERPNSKLTMIDAEMIRSLYPALSHGKIANTFGVCKKTVSNILHGVIFKS